ncbi:MAG: protein translocase subunit SecF [Candidatus Eremiobacteraeota bacterium]|nr:protein translocase subunit SecF [Candidatus Eremiobacteraeota bacterium]
MFFRRLNWNVVGWFRTVSLISYIVIGLGVVALFWHATHAPGGGFQPSHALRLGLSFTGGTDVTVKYTKPATVPDIERALATVGVADARVNTLAKAGDADPNERYTISTQTDFGNDAPRLWSALGTVATVDRTQSQIEAVGPSLGKEYLIKAGEALVIAIVIQFVFIAFRFGWNYIFGLVVVIALVRDAAMMIGIYAIADKRADDAFLAAVLTVIGYSVMDTIVILDRIRENQKVMSGAPYAQIVNTSILQTMTRSVNTLATVVVTLVALLAFGGASLQNFAFALLVGICSGGYHSIFYSAPLVNVLRERQLRSAAGRRSLQRATALERPRTVAEARAQQAAAVSREDILAARKERRKKVSGRPNAAGPVRYKKKRVLPSATSAVVPLGETYEDDESEYEEDDASGEPGSYAVDPLDAQNAGLHEQELALGHEEIRLNLDELPHDRSAAPLLEDGDGGAAEHPATVKHE